MPYNTEDAIKAVKEDTEKEIKELKDDTQQKFDTLNTNLNQGFKAVSDAVKETNQSIINTNLEVKGISTKMEGLVDEPMLIRTVQGGIEKHELKEHKSKPPPKLSRNPTQNGGSINIKIPFKLGAYGVGGVGVLYALWDLLIKAFFGY